jgi:hypothetical protein
MSLSGYWSFIYLYFLIDNHLATNFLVKLTEETIFLSFC